MRRVGLEVVDMEGRRGGGREVVRWGMRSRVLGWREWEWRVMMGIRSWCVLLRLLSSVGRGERVLTLMNQQPEAFPETARRQVPVPGQQGGGQPHVRRKSVIPLDATILKELASHKS